MKPPRKNPFKNISYTPSSDLSMLDYKPVVYNNKDIIKYNKINLKDTESRYSGKKVKQNNAYSGLESLIGKFKNSSFGVKGIKKGLMLTYKKNF